MSLGGSWPEDEHLGDDAVVRSIEFALAVSVGATRIRDCELDIFTGFDQFFFDSSFSLMERQILNLTVDRKTDSSYRVCLCRRILSPSL
jgi:hypothetical protein